MKSILSSKELVTQKGQPIKRIKIAENLTYFPEEIMDYAETLEILDLSGNQLTTLPDTITALPFLKVLFLSNNCFTVFPNVLYHCPKLEMIGFKANKIKIVDESTLPTNTRWLILTDNAIEKLPDDFGRLHRLQKCMLAGNQLTELPDSIAQCQALQLLRISANNLQHFPKQVLALPNLAWIALAGNPFSSGLSLSEAVSKVPMNALTLGPLLGEGASGLIYRASVNQKACAVKLFKGEVTSDGFPQDELLASLQIPEHPSIVKVIAHIDTSGSEGVVMDLIPARFKNLGMPPSLKSCTRDEFEGVVCFDQAQVVSMVEQMVDAIAHIHHHDFIHGDIYAHNVLVDDKGQLLFGDMGAASYIGHLSADEKNYLWFCEYRALAYFVEDVIHRCANFEIAALPKEHVLIRIDTLCQGLILAKTEEATFLEQFKSVLSV